uniref:Uncharacterized protein n=1 Tax=Oryza sativa subsp. japonica TaxID=39947 RepID=Q67X30_ORYSJ|nr:hypothetical protein [Oryza sativa Japonica Group]
MVRAVAIAVAVGGWSPSGGGRLLDRLHRQRRWPPAAGAFPSSRRGAGGGGQSSKQVLQKCLGANRKNPLVSFL